jgi:two-component system sensor histidine kinase MprB
MVTALARSRQQQQRLVSDASHELRTPLTSLRSNTELLRRIERLPEAERHEVVDDVLEDIDELTAVVAELVDLASDTAAVESVEPVRLAELARTVAVRAGRRHQRPVTVVDRAPRDVWGRPRQLERAISNLVDNAIKYSPSTTAVEILVDGAGVCVLDRGPGVAEAERERIFDRFYRSVRDRGRPGSGLGLAIVADIVGRHGGQVFAAARDGGGAAVGFRLPG